MKKIFIVFCLCMIVCLSVFFVGCDNEIENGNEGLVYRVSFNLNNGSTEENVYQNVEYGEKVKEITNVSRIGYKFLGWYRGGAKWDFDVYTVTANIIIEARWEKEESLWEKSEGLLFEFDENLDGYVVCGISEDISDVVIPTCYSEGEDAHYVVKIGDNAFKDSNIESIFMPATVKYVGDQAFLGCNNLKTIVGEEELSYVGNSAFEGCSSLSEFKFSENLVHIGDYAFSGTRIEEFCLSTSLNNLGSFAFFESSLKEIKQIGLGEFSLKEIKPYCFSKTNLTTFTLVDSIEEVGDYAFFDSELKFVYFGSKSRLRKMGDYAFSQNKFETLLILPEALETVGDGCFSSNDSLTEFLVHKNLKFVGREAFASQQLKPNYIYVYASELNMDNFSSSYKTLSTKVLFYDESATMYNGWSFVNGAVKQNQKVMDLTVDLITFLTLNPNFLNEYVFRLVANTDNVDAIREVYFEPEFVDPNTMVFSIDRYAYKDFRLCAFSDSATTLDLKSCQYVSKEIDRYQQSLILTNDFWQ